MVDYVPVLARAVAGLDPNTKEARRAVYDRARRALIDGLRSSDPTLSDTDLRTQSAALEAAIRRVEGDALRSASFAPTTATPGAAPPPAADELQPEPPFPEDLPPPATGDATYEDQPPLQEERKPRRLIGAGVAAAALIAIGFVIYMFLPFTSSSVPPSQRGVAGKRADPETAGAPPYVYLRQPVYFRSSHPVGTIVIDKQQSFLYVVRPSLSALRYGIGVGPECTAAAGLYQIVRKEEWPGMKPSAGREPTEEERNKNPLGARAIHLSKENQTRIHGTNAPSTIGRPGSIGCFRLANEDVIYLYDRTPLETRVVVLN